MKPKFILPFVIVLLAACGSAYAYEFWGVTVGTGSYGGYTNLTFDGLAGSNIGYSVGAYPYTGVDGQWLGPYAAASPGAQFLASRKSDALGLFFLPDPTAARFVVMTGSTQNGTAAPELGMGARLFGPGDLRLDVGDRTYGIGLRQSGLLWAIDPATTNPEYVIYRAGGGTDSIYSRDAGTLGAVELNPRWDRAGHSALSSSSDRASAFFVSGSGYYAGAAQVSFENTGIALGGAAVYAYTISVPWSVLQIDPHAYNFRASWRPDCGNDVIDGQFSGTLNSANIPEPASALTFGAGVVGLAVKRKRG